MQSTVQIRGQKKYGSATATAGTVINRMIEPMLGAIANIEKMVYINAGEFHTLTVMRVLGKTTFAAAAAASQAAVVLTADPGDYAATWRTADNLIAAGDYVIYKAYDGTYVMDTVASGSGTTPTLTTNLPTLGVKAGDPFWFFGIKTDTNPRDALPHPTFTIVPTGSGWGVKTIDDVVSALDFYEPMIVQSTNLTTAGTLNQVCVVYTDRPGPNSPTPSTLTL